MDGETIPLSIRLPRVSRNDFWKNLELLYPSSTPRVHTQLYHQTLSSLHLPHSLCLCVARILSIHVSLSVSLSLSHTHIMASLLLPSCSHSSSSSCVSSQSHLSVSLSVCLSCNSNSTSPCSPPLLLLSQHIYFGILFLWCCMLTWTYFPRPRSPLRSVPLTVLDLQIPLLTSCLVSSCCLRLHRVNVCFFSVVCVTLAAAAVDSWHPLRRLSVTLFLENLAFGVEGLGRIVSFRRCPATSQNPHRISSESLSIQSCRYLQVQATCHNHPRTSSKRL